MYIQIWRKQNWFYSSDDRRKYYIEFVIVPKCGISNFFYQQFFNLFIWVCFWSTISFSKHNLCNKPDWCPEKKIWALILKEYQRFSACLTFSIFYFFSKYFAQTLTGNLFQSPATFNTLTFYVLFMSLWSLEKKIKQASCGNVERLTVLC